MLERIKENRRQESTETNLKLPLHYWLQSEIVQQLTLCWTNVQDEGTFLHYRPLVKCQIYSGKHFSGTTIFIMPWGHLNSKFVVKFLLKVWCHLVYSKVIRVKSWYANYSVICKLFLSLHTYSYLSGVFVQSYSYFCFEFDKFIKH